VSSSVPPISELESPSAETVTSRREPTSMPAGRSAVTITAATLRLASVLPRTLMPMRSSIAPSACWVNGALRSESPLPARPITRP
jgi:hypothetical protein